MNLGNPAPVAMKTAWKPISPINCGMVKILPTMWSTLISTPILRRLAISWSTIALGRRNSGMPYLRTPPATWRASKTVTWRPARAQSAAQVRPPGPLPMTATFSGRFRISGTLARPWARA